MTSGDTIAAISSAVGPAARIIVRLSGPDALRLACELGIPTDRQGGSAFRCNLSFLDLTVPSWIYLFRAPRSYTGEDLIEFHLPGSPVLVKMLLEELIRRGARGAEPGEFTARAYFNGRIDLTAAEGVAATIAAGSEQELSAARQLLGGELARRLAPVMNLLADTLALVEVGIDFTEEDVTFLSANDIRDRVTQSDAALATLLSESARFERLAHEPRVVLVGRPNAGKSTLLNALAGRERAVVSDVAGTTRDVLSAEVALPRGMIHLIDVAGIDAEPSGANEIEAKMREHALRALEAADLVVLVVDATVQSIVELSREPALTVRTKIDLLSPPSPGTPGEGRGEGFPRGHAASNQNTDSVNPHPHPLGGSRQFPSLFPEYRARGEILVSARTGKGLDGLRSRLDEICFGERASGATLALNIRHVRAIEEARASLRRLLEGLDHPSLELLAVELREALDALGGILGRLTPDDLLGRIFAGFCIGK
ncbi:MAG TPA: tRNA modification GTPase [Tepidisphaeraceae bacterium]|nr:tRNA modification GTPase [Tepidisphaeraceae bacterium]